MGGWYAKFANLSDAAKQLAETAAAAAAAAAAAQAAAKDASKDAGPHFAKVALKVEDVTNATLVTIESAGQLLVSMRVTIESAKQLLDFWRHSGRKFANGMFVGIIWQSFFAAGACLYQLRRPTDDDLRGIAATAAVTGVIAVAGWAGGFSSDVTLMAFLAYLVVVNVLAADTTEASRASYQLVSTTPPPLDDGPGNTHTASWVQQEVLLLLEQQQQQHQQQQHQQQHHHQQHQQHQQQQQQQGQHHHHRQQQQHQQRSNAPPSYKYSSPSTSRSEFVP
jgi:hypothetical protein